MKKTAKSMLFFTLMALGSPAINASTATTINVTWQDTSLDSYPETLRFPSTLKLNDFYRSPEFQDVCFQSESVHKSARIVLASGRALDAVELKTIGRKITSFKWITNGYGEKELDVTELCTYSGKLPLSLASNNYTVDYGLSGTGISNAWGLRSPKYSLETLVAHKWMVKMVCTPDQTCTFTPK